MPSGYLVQLGDGSLDHGDTITSTYSSFTTDQNLGAGNWSWTGSHGGTPYTNEVEPGVYYLATDGNVYFVPDFGPPDTFSSATADSPPAYTDSDGPVEGTSGADNIDSSYTDADGDQIDNGSGGGASGNQDTVEAGAGDDTVNAGADNDMVFGGSGGDSLAGGSGDDTIYGDSSSEAGLTDSDQSITNANVTDTSSGFTVTARDLSGTASAANIDYYDGGFGVAGAISDSDSSVDAQVGYDKASGISEEIIVDFDQDTDDVSFSFKHLYTDSFGEEGHWAIYKDGVLIAEGDFTEDVAGSGTGTINISGYGDFDQLVLSANLQTDGTDGSDYMVTDITFTVPAEVPADGNDSIDGGTGNDLIYGQGGNDTISGQSGNDTLYGGTGDDTLWAGTGDDLVYGGDGDDLYDTDEGNDTFYGEGGDDWVAVWSNPDGETLVGGETDETLGDMLELYGDGSSINITFTSDEAGTFTVGADTVTFSEFERYYLHSGDDTLDASIGTSDIWVQGLGGNNVFTGGSGNDTLLGGGGSDTLRGNAGADSLDGGSGDDSLIIGEGDTATGGDGDDYFTVEDTGDTGSNDIYVTGGDTGQTTGDTLDFNGQLVLGSVNITDNTGGSLTGTATLLDGSTVHFSGIENIICFTAGTRIATSAGLRCIETLRTGDLVMTRDNGLQPVRWISQSTVPATGNLAPIRIKAGQFGAERDLLVSPQHRMLFSGSQASLLFGESEVLVSAVHMLNDRSIRREPGGSVTYVHVLFGQHEIIYAEGAASESFHPGVQAVSALEEPVREELFRIMPDLRWHNGEGGRTARLCASRHEAALLLPRPSQDQ
ncbi:Hint domain-containing protein [Leisingera sp. S132]|uniref:Hint domain-containing protein n=1 Tax=Leisingera sp. S132 TaxID=2867016 RepID=UPI0021A915CA|nr:Hint domain-containing protein [Leisingera sp. S132]UWQ80638.1 Hint domain-containing protein [Leisingera sp. S132]